MTESKQTIRLILPTQQDFVLVARMAISGLGMLAGLDIDLIADLRTVTNECCDCLLHQPRKPENLLVEASLSASRLTFLFGAQGRAAKQSGEALDLEIMRGVLETLMPDVLLNTDEGGVFSIECSMPV